MAGRGGDGAGAAPPEPPPRAPGGAFLLAAGFTLALQAWLLFGTPGLVGGADLAPHLRLIQRMGEDPGLRNVYAPAYHALGALLAPWVGIERYPELFALASLAALLAAFRAFQRAAGLPEAAAVLFALWPYWSATCWCLPKVEVAGYAVALLGWTLLLRGRAVGLALAVPAAFLLHTAAALVLGLVGGVLALARREPRTLAALAAGTLLASPLPLAHLADGCTLAQALLLSPGDYLRSEPLWSLRLAEEILWLAQPPALALAAWGAPRLWRAHRAAAVVALVLLLLYANELWLAPFGRGTTLNLLRGLSLLAVPVAAAAGAALEGRRGWLLPVAAFCALWTLVTTATVVPRVCHVAPRSAAEAERLEVSRCLFRWRPSRPAAPRAPDGGEP